MNYNKTARAPAAAEEEARISSARHCGIWRWCPFTSPLTLHRTQKAFRNEGIYLRFFFVFWIVSELQTLYLRILNKNMVYIFFVLSFFSQKFFFFSRLHLTVEAAKSDTTVMAVIVGWMTAWLLLASTTISRESIREKVNKWHRMKTDA